MPTALSAGGVAVVGYNTGQTDGNGSTVDSVQIVLLNPITTGTVIYITDRAWNGTAFTAGGGDGTTTYTASGDLPAGTVINLTIGGGLDLDQNGDSIYVYQGTDANTPTSFLYAIEIADGNTTFNGSLVNTGLTAGQNAVGVALDSANYSGPTTAAHTGLFNGGQTLLQSISDASNWVGDDADGAKALDQPNHSGPYGTSPDFQIITGTSGGGGGIVTVGGDSTVSGGNSGYNLTQIYTNLLSGGINVFYGIKDIVFDTVHGKFFVADSDGTGGHNRVLQGNISDFLGNPSSVPALTVLYSDPTASNNARITKLDIDPNNGIVYFDHGPTFGKVNYNTAGQAITTLANLGTGSGNPNGTTNNFIDDFVINHATGAVYLTSHRIVAAADGDQVSRNYIYRITGLDSSDGAGAFTFGGGNLGVLPFSPDDDDANNGITFAAGEGFPQELGTVEGVALSADGNTLYFSVARTLYDHDGDGGFAGDGNAGTTDPILTLGGIYSYALTGNAAGVYTAVYVPTDDGNDGSFAINPGFGPQGLLDELEIDPITGDLFFIDWTGDQNGATNQIGDEGIWRVDTDGTPDASFFHAINNINGNPPTSIFLNRAPTVSSSSSATPTVTEPGGTNSGATALVQPFLTANVTDVDTADQTDQLAGAVIRVSSGFQSGATHQDTLTINGLTSGTLGTGIGFSYNASTGVMVLTGANTFDNYEAAIALVRFNTSGDNPTAFGTATSRTISWSVSDGLAHSDEVSTTVTVVGVNDAPVHVVPTAQNIAEDATRLFSTGNGNALSVSDVDADPASQALQVTLSVGTGTLTLASTTGLSFSVGDGTGDATMTFTGTANAINTALGTGLTYTSVLDHNGAVTLSILTSDQGFNGTGGALTDSDNVTINIAAVADIADDTVNIGEDAGAQNLNLLANDTFENTGRAITAVGTASHGTVSINNNGTAGDATDDFVVYTAVADYYGSDSFTYTVTSGGVTETATVTVNVSATADIADDSITIAEDAGTTTLDLLANDSFENAGRAITAVGAAANGTVLINNNGTAGDTTDDFVTYRPNDNWNGTDSFTYTVTSGGVTETATMTVTVTAVDDPAVANDDPVNVTPENAVLANIDILGNDVDIDGPAPAVATVDGQAFVGGTTITLASGALVTMNLDGTLTYDPNGAFDHLPESGSGASNIIADDTFSYTVVGGDSAVVTVSVTGVDTNDTLLGSAGTDILDGGIGNNTMSYANAGSAVDVNLELAGTAQNTLGGGTDTLNNIQNLTGSSFNDRLTGDAGANVLDGGLGADRMKGRAGDDIYYVDNIGDQTVELVGQGNDTVRATVSFSLAGQQTERLELLGSANLTGAGNSLDNVIIGNAGDNELKGRGGNDTYIVQNVGDHVFELDGEGTDTVESSVNFTLAGQFIENLTLTGSANLNGSGNSLDNEITGNSGNNTLTADGGNDMLDGGVGADQMHGGVGDDTYIVNEAGDAAYEAAGEGHDTVRSAIGYSLGGQAIEDLVLTGVASVNGDGNDLDNAITGNAGANRLKGLDGNDEIDGGAGADDMHGGAGDDSYVVDDMGDLVTELAGEGHDTVLSSVSFTLASEFLEDLTLTGLGNINGQGNNLANAIDGNAGANELAGLGGNDEINGGAGADKMSGGTGDDSYVVDNIGDRAYEATGEGHDTVTSMISYALAGQSVEDLILAGGSAINGSGNSLDNAITGNSAANMLIGGLGSDTLTGGGGADSFYFNEALGATNVDAVTDFAAGVDKLMLDRSIFSAISKGPLANYAFVTGTAAADANDRIIYDGATGNVYYDADGNGGGAAVHFATLDTGLSLQASDFFVYI